MLYCLVLSLVININLYQISTYYWNFYKFPFQLGCIWGIANACFLIASTILSQAVIFPIGL